ncbi:endonuclease/exonuclease/phosphatase family protein [Paenibacillus motobuensis]|uniref:Endonuclease/exonuclease/phosphatase domain-containing protein n=1 Tax=Paenibacillus motobuensis TaxID=295324 RepID=A0ABP3IEC5_9BACL
MKLLQYNILDGCQDAGRFARLSAWISAQTYDIICFNELNGWSDDELQKQAEDWGFSYSWLFQMKKSRYFIGVVSKFPIEVIEQSETGWYHGLLHVRIHGVHLLIAHLSSASAKERQFEAKLIIKRLKKVELANEPLALIGDLNTLSPADNAIYESNQLVRQLVQDEFLNRKFLDNEEINYRPIQILLDAGLIDAAIHRDLPFQSSVPTLINKDKMHAAELRLDYALVNAILNERHPVARIICDEYTDMLSDHYPLECCWQNNYIDGTKDS